MMSVVINPPRSQHQGPPKKRDGGILTLLAELALEVFKGLDLESAVRLSATCTKLRGVFQTPKETLILSILAV